MKLAEIIAKKTKSFSDGEFVKDCLLTAVKCVTPSKLEMFEKISLSRQTVTRRVEEMSSNVEETLKKKLAAFLSYSIALDESTDSTDTAQLAIFIRGVNENLEVLEELLALYPLKGTTRGVDIYNATKATLQNFNLNMQNLVGVVTDGAPSMIGKNSGCVKLLKEESNSSNIISYHCIIHQENLCAKSLGFENVMKVVTAIINFIRARGLNHRQFQNFLETKCDQSPDDIIYFCEVRWLSHARVLKIIFELNDAVQEFMTEKGKQVIEFTDPKWMADFAFLTDISCHLNDLNIKLQSKNQLVHTLFNHIKAFKIKLELFKIQLLNRNLTNFKTMVQLEATDYAPDYAINITQLQNQFEERFRDFVEQEKHVMLVTNPFSADVFTAPADIQMELIELQADAQLKIRHSEVPILDFYQKYLPQANFPNIRKNVAKILSLFGSTYICEQLFSRMKYAKSKNISKLTDCHLEHCLCLGMTDIKPDVDSLIKCKQSQCSH